MENIGDGMLTHIFGSAAFYFLAMPAMASVGIVPPVMPSH